MFPVFNDAGIFPPADHMNLTYFVAQYFLSTCSAVISFAVLNVCDNTLKIKFYNVSLHDM